jgi:hypothetical protein
MFYNLPATLFSTAKVKRTATANRRISGCAMTKAVSWLDVNEK